MFNEVSRTSVGTGKQPSALLPAVTPYRVLIVDDNEQTCQLIQDVLAQCSDLHVVGRVHDGLEAIAAARLQKPDVVLMDVNLPTIDGVQATYSIREACQRVVIIGMSEQFTPPLYSAMRTAGAAAFACKTELLGLHQTILSTLQNPLTSALMSRFHLGVS